MTNVSPGDLAMVVNCDDSRFNGATCEVLERAPARIEQMYGRVRYWDVRFARAMPWSNAPPGSTDSRQGFFPDMWLRKISGPPAARESVREIETAAQ